MDTLFLSYSSFKKYLAFVGYVSADIIAREKERSERGNRDARDGYFLKGKEVEFFFSKMESLDGRKSFV